MKMKTKFDDSPPIVTYSRLGNAIEKYGKNALDEGTTASARDLVLKMSEILNME
jgi:hypothetical protein